MKMKKVLTGMALVAAVVLAACGGSETPKGPQEETVVKEDKSKNPDYEKGLALVGKSDCLTCHKVNEASTGPAYADVAAKYADASDTTITRLANTIIKGGSGQWGAVPMTPHPGISEDDAKQMVKYVLLLKK
jgi:cytochrome c